MFNTDINLGGKISIDREMNSPSPLSSSQQDINPTLNLEISKNSDCGHHLSSTDSFRDILNSSNDSLRPMFKRSVSSNSKYSQLPQLDTKIDDDKHVKGKNSLEAEKKSTKSVKNVNESLLETLNTSKASNTSNAPNVSSERSNSNSSISSIPAIPVAASILSNSSNPTPITPQVRSGGSISFQVPTQKHRGSISARPSTTKVSLLDSPQTTGIPSNRKPANANPTISRKTSVNTTLEEIKSLHNINSVNNINNSNDNISNINNNNKSPKVSSNLTFNNNIITPVSSASVYPPHAIFDKSQLSSTSNALKRDNKDINTTNAKANTTTADNSVFISPLQSRNSSVSDKRSPSSINDLISGLEYSSINNSCSTNNENLSITSVVSKKKTVTPKTVVTSSTGPVVPFTEYLSKNDDGKIHILIGATGSVATIKIPLIINKLFKIYGVDNVSIQLVVTQAAEHFLKGCKISTEVKIWREQEEWSNPMTKLGDPILHVELRKWSDIFLIAPISANTLSKVSNGLADNLLTSIVRVWNPAIPILIAPAMNTFMYNHPITKKQLNILSEDFKFIEVLKPIEKVLVCGDIGMGGMREWSEIVDILVRKLKEIQKLKEKSKITIDNTIEMNINDQKIDDEDEDEDEEDDEDDEDYDDEDDDDDEDDEDDEDDDDDDDDDDEDDDEDEEDDITTDFSAITEANSPTKEIISSKDDLPSPSTPSTNPYIVKNQSNNDVEQQLKASAGKHHKSMDDLTDQVS